MSLTMLAEKLDSLATQSNVYIAEDDRGITVSNLKANEAIDTTNICSQLGWSCNITDDGNSETSPENIHEDFAPFRIHILKPPSADGTFTLLTETAFAYWLQKGHEATCWRIARLTKPIITLGRTYNQWTGTPESPLLPETKSPRNLVKESNGVRVVPEDVRIWLLKDNSIIDFGDPIHLTWSVKAFEALSFCLANEVSQEDNSLIFRGPPKLKVQPAKANNISLTEFGRDSFITLQEAAIWVFENSRETELKHGLLASEIARSGRENNDLLTYLKSNLAISLESARIAYQMSISDITKETLKSLGDLRKAVTEETAKATDATRQTITAVSGALAVGIGLLAARLNTAINPMLVLAILTVIIAYTSMISYSGWRFINLQRKLREDWQPKLYRFLPQDEYNKIVKNPSESAEQTFKWTASLGLISVILMSAGVLFFGIKITSDPTSNIDKALTKEKDNTLKAPTNNFNHKIAPLTTTYQHTCKLGLSPWPPTKHINTNKSSTTE